MTSRRNARAFASDRATRLSWRLRTRQNANRASPAIDTTSPLNSVVSQKYGSTVIGTETADSTQSWPGSRACRRNRKVPGSRCG